MTDDVPPRRALRAAIDAAEPPTESEVALKLADSDVWDGDDGEAYAAVTRAREAGVLVEEDREGLQYPVVALADELEESGETDDAEPTAGDERDGGNDVSDYPDPAREGADKSGWGDADFTSPQSGIYPADHRPIRQWMMRREGAKNPYAPWTDPDSLAPCDKHDEPVTCAECDHSARYKWGWDGNYRTAEAARMAEDDPELGGRTFIQLDRDPFAFVDGDDVRDPDTGEVHPAFRAILEHLGVTYADVSTSGGGVHAYYFGDLPEDVPQATFALDTEPWGANEEPPEIEIYANKHVCVTTGEHIPGTPERVNPWDEDALRAILDANGQLPEESAEDDPAIARQSFDAEEYDPGATDADETTDDIRDVFAALDRIDAREVAGRTIVHRWNDDASTSGEKRAFVPTWGTDAGGTANVVDREIWQDTGGGGYGGPVVMALIDNEKVKPESATPRVSGKKWWHGVELLRDMGYSIPEHVPPEDDDGVSPTDRDVTLDPGVAWRAAEAVVPDVLKDDLDVPADGDGWQCPHCGEAVDVVRAAALDLGLVMQCDTALDAEEYTRAYNYARETCGAPLPEYVNSATATRNWDVVTGALRELTFNHLDRDALASDVTATGNEVSGEGALTLDPAWRESESGKSVLVFESGTVYEAHPDYEGALDPLRFVALDAGVLAWEEVAESDSDPALTGERFRKVYRLARQRYGAPLPEWEHGDANHTPALPPVDSLVDARQDTDAQLEAAYDRVADEYDRAATTDDATLLRVLPGLGKTENVFRQADEFPALYTAGRKELMAAAAERAEQNDVSAFPLPVFSERGPPGAVVDAGVEAVREHGQGLLREPWRLVKAIKDRLAATADPNLPDGIPDPEACEPDDDVNLERASCTTADGEYSRSMWVAVHVARGLGYSPRYIHTHDAALFGDELPCRCGDDAEGDHDSDGCPYSAAWKRATDPDAPIDVLVGHYTHAHVQGARTYYTRQPNGRIDRQRRVVAIDEFPGDAYADTFGEEFADIAAWLAGCLREDVDDRQGMFQTASDLWDDDHLQAWLTEDDATEMDDYGAATDALGQAADALDAVDDAEWLLENLRKACASLGIDDAVQRLVDTFPEWDPVVVRNVAATVTDAAEGNRGAPTDVMRHVSRLADRLQGQAGDADRPLTDRLEDALAADHISGDLAALVDRAVGAYREREERASVLLRNAMTALRGGEAGVEELAAYADDGHAHPQAHALLYGVLAPDGEREPATTIETDAYSFDPEPGTRLQRVPFGHDTVLVDRQHNGALVMDPPAFTAGGGQNPVVGLDATGRRRLWELATGREVTPRDIHDSDRERKAFLRDVYGLRMLQTSLHMNSYEGDPSGKNFDDDVAVVETAGEEYGGTVLDTGAGLDDEPAVVTTKVVENTVDELEAVASETAHYGDLKGSERLKDHRLAALLGCQHYGDAFIERWAALGGEEVTRTGHGTHLDYNSAVANTALRHMREDQVMQAALRFGRDTDGAVVLAHTAALRDDLPVVGEGEVIKTFSKRAQAVAEVGAGMAGRRFTSGDVYARLKREDVDISKRTVRRVLAELAGGGYLDREEHGEGVANEYDVVEIPGAAEIDLPGGETVGATEEDGDDPGQNDVEVSYTVSVRVPRPTNARPSRETAVRAILDPPDAASGAAPPG